MIIHHKGGFIIGPKYIRITVDVQLRNDEYDIGIGANIDTNAIANKAIKEVGFDSQIYGIFSKYITEWLTVEFDDCYEYDSISQMLSNRDENLYDKWLEKYETLQESIFTVEFNDKLYNCYIHVFINK